MQNPFPHNSGSSPERTTSLCSLQITLHTASYKWKHLVNLISNKLQNDKVENTLEAETVTLKNDSHEVCDFSAVIWFLFFLTHWLVRHLFRQVERNLKHS